MRSVMNIAIVVIVAIAVVFFWLRSNPRQQESGGRVITAEEAKTLMQDGAAYTLVDVRTPEEYASGYIPGAINIPNETIGTARPENLPDLSARILVYCRSGRRSREAVSKLAAMGYTDLYDMGGIQSWTGEIVRP